MQQLKRHKVIFPLSSLLVNAVKFSVTFAMLVVIVLLTGHSFSWAWVSLVPLMGILFLLILGLSCGVAAISPFIPDFQMILGTLLQLMFFMSGIFFDLSRLSATLRRYLQFNPMAILIENFRRVLLNGQWPQWHLLLLPLSEACVITGLSLLLLHRFNKLYPKLS